MNIKIDKELHNKLQYHVIDTIQFGNKSGDDKDLLCILAPNFELGYSLTNTDHCLHYKSESQNIDYLYMTPRQILRSLIFATNPVNYELLINLAFKDSCLDFLYEYDFKEFCTYKMIKSFIGVAQRDLKQIDAYNINKKLGFVRTYLQAVSRWLCFEIDDIHFMDKRALKALSDVLREELNGKQSVLPLVTSPEIVYNLQQDLVNKLPKPVYLGIDELVEIYHKEIK